MGTSGLALAPFVLFLAVALLAGCLVGGHAVVWVCGCGSGRVFVARPCAAYFWWVWLVAGWPVGCLVQEGDATKQYGPRLGRMFPEARARVWVWPA